MREFAERLGIPLRTVKRWIAEDPELSELRPRPGDIGGLERWIRLDALANRPGFDLMEAYLLGIHRWIKAATLARLAGISRHTMRDWCNNRPGFAKRIGRIFYVDLQDFGADFDDVEDLFSRLRECHSSGTTYPDSEGSVDADR